MRMLLLLICSLALLALVAPAADLAPSMTAEVPAVAPALPDNAPSLDGLHAEPITAPLNEAACPCGICRYDSWRLSGRFSRAGSIGGHEEGQAPYKAVRLKPEAA